MEMSYRKSFTKYSTAYYETGINYYRIDSISLKSDDSTPKKWTRLTGSQFPRQLEFRKFQTIVESNDSSQLKSTRHLGSL